MLKHTGWLLGVMLCLFTLPTLAQEHGADELIQSWSPDGRTLFFTTNRNGPGTQDLYAINRNGTGLRALTTGKYVRQAVPSPDGTMLALTVMENESYHLEVLNLVDETLTPWVSGGNLDHFLAWSPDSRQMLASTWYYEGAGGMAELIDLDRGVSITLVVTEFAGPPEGGWTPGTNQIYLYGETPSLLSYEFYLVNPDSTLASENLLRNYADFTRGDFWVTWSPDGTRFAFHQDDDSNIYIVDVATATVMPLVYVRLPLYSAPVWLKDNSGLVYAMNADADALQGVFQVDLVNRLPELLLETSLLHVWRLSPDETQVMAFSSDNLVYPTWFLSLDTGETATLQVEYTNGMNALWSPDGIMVAASICVDDDYDVYLIDTLSGNGLNLTEADAFPGEPVSSYCPPL